MCRAVNWSRHSTVEGAKKKKNRRRRNVQVCQRHKRCDGGRRGLREKGTHTDHILFTSLVKGASGALWWHVFTSAVMLMETRHNSSAVAPPCARYAPLLTVRGWTRVLCQSPFAVRRDPDTHTHTLWNHPFSWITIFSGLNTPILWSEFSRPNACKYYTRNLEILKGGELQRYAGKKNKTTTAFYWLLWLSHTHPVAIWIKLCRI